jgi:hypothetical protein
MAATIPKKTGFGSRRRTTEVIPSAVIGGHVIPTLLSFTITPSATQYYSEVEIAVCNKDGQVIPAVHVIDVYISSLATGLDVIATGPATSFALKANAGATIAAITANKVLKLATLATGKVTVVLADDVTPVLLYVAAVLPSCGKVQVSRKTVAGDYGA